MVKRWLQEEFKARTVLANPTAVGEFLQIHFVGLEYESFVFLYTQNRAEEMFRGMLTQSSVYPLGIVKCALSRNTASGAVTQSPQRSCGARRSANPALKAAPMLVDIRVLDHIILRGRWL
jgi:DNA repair protein RadC